MVYAVDTKTYCEEFEKDIYSHRNTMLYLNA